MQNQPIQTTALFRELDQLLIELLEDCSRADWNKPTIAKRWTVKDIAAHLLDGNLRGISIYRDNYIPEKPADINTYQDLVNYLDEFNATWVTAAKRLSPELLTELLRTTGKAYCNGIAKLDLYAPAVFPVAWAGEHESQNWFHIAREYTEKFIHQMQIREALGKKEALFTKALYYPFIATFMYGLPHTYRNTAAQDKTVVEIIIETEAGGQWFLVRFDNSWVLDSQTLFTPATTVVMQPDTAWKLFSKGISKQEALADVKIMGDLKLGETALNMIAIMG